ncbi:unnamed protein product [Arabis nemorensis]|uniref:Uncharacterized protein n=1 Tax=Arabis nemorensis TaxID=586526 RepID=A0A565CL37_9BRAS|nr:unnamed protein product [Arabis nemorensis]
MAVVDSFSLLFSHSGHHMRRKTTTVGPGAVYTLPRRQVRPSASVVGNLLTSGSEFLSVLNRSLVLMNTGNLQPLLIETAASPLQITIVFSLLRSALSFIPENMEKTIFNICSAVSSLSTIEQIPARRNYQSRPCGTRTFSGVPRSTIFPDVVANKAGYKPPDFKPASEILCKQSSNLRNLHAYKGAGLDPTSCATSPSPSICLSEPPLLLPRRNLMTYSPLGLIHKWISKWAWPKLNSESNSTFGHLFETGHFFFPLLESGRIPEHYAGNFKVTLESDYPEILRLCREDPLDASESRLGFAVHLLR